MMRCSKCQVCPATAHFGAKLARKGTECAWGEARVWKLRVGRCRRSNLSHTSLRTVPPICHSARLGFSVRPLPTLLTGDLSRPRSFRLTSSFAANSRVETVHTWRSKDAVWKAFMYSIQLSTLPSMPARSSARSRPLRPVYLHFACVMGPR